MCRVLNIGVTANKATLKLRIAAVLQDPEQMKKRKGDV